MSKIQVRLDNVICNYVHVFEPAKDKKGEEKYSVQLIFPKESKAAEMAKKAILEVAQSRWGNLFKNGKFPPSLKNPLRDGADRESDVYEGMYFVNTSSRYRPTLLFSDLRKMEDKDSEALYSGCEVNAAVTFYDFDVDSNKGVAVYINGLQLVKQLPSIYNSGNCSDLFEALEAEQAFKNGTEDDGFFNAF